METFCKQLGIYFIVLVERLCHKVYGIKGLTQSHCKWRIGVKRIDLLGSAKRYQTGGSSRFSSMVWKQSDVARNKKISIYLWDRRIHIGNQDLESGTKKVLKYT